VFAADGIGFLAQRFAVFGTEFARRGTPSRLFSLLAAATALVSTTVLVGIALLLLLAIAPAWALVAFVALGRGLVLAWLDYPRTDADRVAVLATWRRDAWVRWLALGLAAVAGLIGGPGGGMVAYFIVLALFALFRWPPAVGHGRPGPGHEPRSTV
jgi:hypothetical protein